MSESNTYIMLIRIIVLLQCTSEINTYLKYVHHLDYHEFMPLQTQLDILT